MNNFQRLNEVRVENFLFRATREYTEAGLEQRCLGANSPEPRRRAVIG